jgi:hypothetical protein
MPPPASRYKISPRHFSSTLPPIEYGPGDKVRKVSEKGKIKFSGKFWRVGKAFCGYPVEFGRVRRTGVSKFTSASK